MAYEHDGQSANGQATESEDPITCDETQYNNTVGPVAWEPTDDQIVELGFDDFADSDVFRYFTIKDQPDIQAGNGTPPQLGTVDDDAEGLRSLADHVYQVNAAFEKKNIDYQIAVQDPINPEDWELFGSCRRYVLPRQYRDNERNRLQFLQIFNCDRPYNRALKGYRYKMSVLYETRNPLPTSAYSPPGNDPDQVPTVTAFNPLNPNGDPTLIPSSSPTPSTSSPAPTTPRNRDVSPLSFGVKAGTQKSTQPRMKPIPKPQRQVAKNREGKFVCTWPECGSKVREFSRKCEWSKHMDKHERPYKCLAAGCENIPGFTYSGGLLRHEREVHRKHGGPKNPLYCPHRGCKRHKDSSFARLENLNEHLRRCHTPNGLDQFPQGDEPDAQPAEPARLPALPMVMSLTPDEIASPRIGSKRKADDDDLREEIKRLRLENQELRRLRFENQELKRKIEAGYLQQSAMMEQIDTLEKDNANLLRQQSLSDPHLMD